MERTQQQLSQASNNTTESPFSAVFSDSSASRSTTSYSRTQASHDHSGVVSVLGAVSSTFSRCAWARCTGNDRQFTAYYFAFVLAMRFFLKSSAAGVLPEMVVMLLEDGLSIMSFVVGTFYLHNSEGITRMLLRKRTGQSPSPEANEVEPVSQPEIAQHRARLTRDIKLFLFAM